MGKHYIVKFSDLQSYALCDSCMKIFEELYSFTLDGEEFRVCSGCAPVTGQYKIAT